MEKNLDKILSDKPKAKVTVLLVSELEIGSEVEDPRVIKNLGNVVKNSPEKIDAVIINGIEPYVPGAYGKDIDYFKMLDSDVEKKYGRELYNILVSDRRKRYGKNRPDSITEGAIKSKAVETLEDVAVIGKYLLTPLINELKHDDIKSFLVYGDKEFNNEQIIQRHLVKSRRYAAKIEEDEEKDPNKTLKKLLGLDKVDPSIVYKINKVFGFSRSVWSNQDDTGIQDMAAKMHNKILSSMFTNGGKKPYANILRGAENIVEINGVRFHLVHAINALYNKNNSFIDPLLNGQARALKKVCDEYEQFQSKVADVYIRAHEGPFDHRTIELDSGKGPIVDIISQSILQDMKSLKAGREKWRRTVDIKRLERRPYSGLIMFSIYDDGRRVVRGLGFEGIKNNLNIKDIEQNMYKIYLASDTHIGATGLNPVGPSQQELLEGILLEVENDPTPKGDRVLVLLGDLYQAGVKLITRGDIQEPQAAEYNEQIEKLGKEDSLENRLANEREKIYGQPIINLGRQMYAGSDFTYRLANQFETIIIAPGNHVRNGADGLNEAYAVAAMFKTAGVKNVTVTDKYVLNNKTMYIYQYPTNARHSPGFRGGKDIGRANADMIVNTAMNVLLNFTGDAHIDATRVETKEYNNKEVALLGVMTPAVQPYTPFERDIVQKVAAPRGIKIVYLSKDESINTTYFKVESINEKTLEKILAKNGGSSLEKAIKAQYKQ
ncbi:MAG: hypothetical protein M1573_02165 [Candidatus Parvarchaeota archaeon]|nr:hypothetical protein [Candidatus Parvarchaeota archaeon]